MLKLLYEGEHMLAVIDQIKGHSHYVMLDYENYLPFQEESFVYVLDDTQHENRLRSLPEGMAVFLMEQVRARVLRSEYPQLRFLNTLHPEQALPRSISLLGSMEMSLRFTQLLLMEVPYCVGYRCSGYLLDMLKKAALRMQFVDQFSAFRRQNLCLNYDASPAELYIFFWDGSEQMLLDVRKQFEGEWPRHLAVISHDRRPHKDDTMLLPYIGHLSKQELLRRRQLKKYWHKILQFHASSDMIK